MLGDHCAENRARGARTTENYDVDADNPVVQLCADGTAAERRGDFAQAMELFERAWTGAVDDYDRCIAAHYLARHQDGPQPTLEWNERCLRLALNVNDERVRRFFPSLYLNIGRSHEQLGDRQAALASYLQAQSSQCVLGDDPYGTMLRDRITRAIQRTEGAK